MMKTKKNKQLAIRAENALNELSLSVVTKIDKERISRVFRGLQALDDEQANLKYDLEDFCDQIECDYAGDDSEGSKVAHDIVAALRKKFGLKTHIVPMTDEVLNAMLKGSK